MILDWAGLDDSSDSRSDDESSGLGDVASVAAAIGAASASGVMGLVIGIEANLCRPGCFGEGGFVAVFSLSEPAVPPETAVPEGPSLATCGREAFGSDGVASLGVPGVLPSFLTETESFRTDKAEGARTWP